MGARLKEVRPGLRDVGGKARGLILLKKAGLRVPRTWAIPYGSEERGRDGTLHVSAALAAELSALPQDVRYAVRSSADVEDSAAHSFAGQFLSVLDVEREDLAAAVEAVWTSVREPAALAYLQKAGLDPSQVRMAVLVQEMVTPVISGVVFSSNPLTGAAEIVTEMVAGSGELLVQEGRTPARCVSRRGAREGASLLSETAQAEVEKAAERLASVMRHPVDMEFVQDGAQLWFVQVREITALKGLKVYSNTFSKEFLPGMIKPLVWSINNPLVNGAWARLFGEMLGRKDLDPRGFGRLFYYRAYFNTTAVGEIWEAMGLPRDSLEGLMISGRREGMGFRPTPQVMALLPRLALFVLDKVRFTSKLERFLRTSRPRFERFRTLPLAELSDEDLAREMDSLFALNLQSAYYNIITILLTALYERLLKSRLAKAGLRYEELDLSSPGLKAHYPLQALAELHSAYAALDDGAQKGIATGGVASLRQIPSAAALSGLLDRFLQDFGHFSDSGNDFSAVPWEEDP
ncbi:MAG: PEP/pyruvate-binding domain-containing protein, partial [Methanomassiliicoccales archaeon]